jgi:hypothetical protein
MLLSPAWLSLSPVARCILLRLTLIYNGRNNGHLALSVRDAATDVGCSKDTAARAFSDLIDKGFIGCCSRGHFDRKSPHASEYRLTFRECNRTGERPSKAFMHWQDKRSKFKASPMTGTAGPASGTHIIYHMGCGAEVTRDIMEERGGPALAELRHAS